MYRIRNRFIKLKYNSFVYRIPVSVVILIIINLTLCLQYSLSNAAALHDNENKKELPEDTCNEVCSTPECTDQASMFLENMDQSVNPCDDFYKFVCGNYEKKTKIPDDKNAVILFSALNEKLLQKLLSEISANVTSDDLESTKKLKVVYQNCLNESNIEVIGKQPYVELLTKLGGWPVLLGDAWKEADYDLEETIYKATSLGLSPNFPFSLSVGTDSENSKKNILKIMSAETTLTDTYYIEDSDNLKAYKAYMVDIAVMLGANPETAKKDMEECFKFEEILFKLKTRPEDLWDISPIENRHTLEDLHVKYPDINWLNIIRNMLNTDNISLHRKLPIEIEGPKFISGLGNVLKTTPKRVLANYQIWREVYGLVDYMPKEFNDRQLIFQRITTGIQKRSPRNLGCMSQAILWLPVAVSANYVRKFFDPKTKEKVHEIVQTVKDQMKINLEQINWMDDTTRKAALEKWENLGSIIAYPDELLDNNKVEEYYKDLKIEPGDFLSNVLNILEFSRNKIGESLNKPNHWSDKAAVAVINAYYDPGKNEIRLPAGILQNPFFNPNRPKYLNYGSMGCVIGHEMTHGFDSNGRKYDKDANYKNWWQNSTLEKFNEKSKCLIDQYSNYTVSQVNLKVNGKLTLGENIADNGGIKLAYHAYQDWVKRNNANEACLPRLNYTPQQMFWISSANTWCSKIRDELVRLLINEDPHSPNQARVSVTFSNVKEFAKDFNCKIGSKMNPEKKCEVW